MKYTRIVCFTNENDTKDLIKYNNGSFYFEFINSFDNLPDADFYIVSLKYGSTIYDKFVNFMRCHNKSKFLFLNEYTETLDDEDFEIRDEENTEHYMFVPSAALSRIKELIGLTTS